jgi:hypothetical protein
MLRASAVWGLFARERIMRGRRSPLELRLRDDAFEPQHRRVETIIATLQGNSAPARSLPLSGRALDLRRLYGSAR